MTLSTWFSVYKYVITKVEDSTSCRSIYPFVTGATRVPKVLHFSTGVVMNVDEHHPQHPFEVVGGAVVVGVYGTHNPHTFVSLALTHNPSFEGNPSSDEAGSQHPHSSKEF